MPIKTLNIDIFSTQNSIFQPLNAECIQILQNKNPILDSQFIIRSQFIRLQLFVQVLKITFLTPKNQAQSVPLFLKLDYTIRAAQLKQKIDGSINKIIGFSILKDERLSYNFESQNTEQIELWIKELSKIIFLSGFSNDFKSVKYLGRGQFAQVWEVQRLKDGRKFAAKIIDKQISYGQINGKEAIYNEIQILKKLSHPNIVQLECVYESQKNLYIVLEYIEGFLFSDLIRKKNHQSETESSGKIEKIHNVNIMKNLLKSIQYLHNLGIVHRDLKPGNIIICTSTYKPYIIDFGLSQFISKQQYLFDCCGSPGYMAPEIFKNRNFNDLKKSDIFSLGCIFYLLLTGQPLICGNSTEQIIQNTKKCQQIIKIKLKSLSSSQSKLLQQMLEQNPQKRITAEQALSHDYFKQAVFDILNEIRKPSSQAEKATSKYSIKPKNMRSRFEQLFNESIIFIENKFSQIKQDEKQNLNSSHNMVQPSIEFTQKIKRRSSRYLSEQNIQIGLKINQKEIKQAQSMKWKKLNPLQRLFIPGIWPMRQFKLMY